MNTAAHPHQRTTIVRIALALTFLAAVTAIVAFRFAPPTEQTACVGCLDASYGGEEVPARYIALTFDDGPTPVHTERILRILDEHDAPATFFMLGEKVMRHPDIVRRVHDAGHEIGNHSYTHARSVHESRERIEWELAETDRLISAVTGQHTVLYRPPYLTDLEPYEVLPPRESKPVWGWVADAGYITVGSDVDTNDWRATSRRAANEHAQQAIALLENSSDSTTRRIMLLHDTPQTAKTLDQTLTVLEEKGYRIVPLSSLLGLEQNDIMPPAQHDLNVVSTALVLTMLGQGFPVLSALVVFVMFVSTLRFFGFLWFKVHRIRRNTITSPARLKPRYAGKVSVLIPAWNESANIQATIRSALLGTRQPDEVIVIDDGSTDDTLEQTRAIAARFPQIVRVLTKENGGKASALNYGLSHATGDIIIAIDSDTVLDALCVDAVARAFADPHVGAVAGKIVPALHTTWLEKYQTLEYLIGQNMDKEVVSSLGAVNIVPGAVGAWRRDIVDAVGGYSKDTLVEDQDLTLAVLGSGSKVLYIPEAVAYTEVPKTWRDFSKQRFRWTYGTFQCIWKYRHYLMEPEHLRLGWIALPYALTFNIILPIVSLGLILSILLSSVLLSSYPTYWLLLVYTFVEVVYGYVALWYEDSTSRRLLVHVPVQRLVYQFFYAGLIAAVLVKVLDGSRAHWSHLVRTGSAQERFDRSFSRPVIGQQAM